MYTFTLYLLYYILFFKSRHRDRSPSVDEDSDYERRHKRKKDKKHKKHKKEKRDHNRHSDSEEEDKKIEGSNRPTLEQLGYSNVNNPFNDINLESKFVWSKKKEWDKKELGLSESEIKRREKHRKIEADEELAKLNKKRAEREIERKLREEEMDRMQRDAELAQMGDWQAKEEEVNIYSYIINRTYIEIIN